MKLSETKRSRAEPRNRDRNRAESHRIRTNRPGCFLGLPGFFTPMKIELAQTRLFLPDNFLIPLKISPKCGYRWKYDGEQVPLERKAVGKVPLKTSSRRKVGAVREESTVGKELTMTVTCAVCSVCCFRLWRRYSTSSTSSSKPSTFQGRTWAPRYCYRWCRYCYRWCRYYYRWCRSCYRWCQCCYRWC